MLAEEANLERGKATMWSRPEVNTHVRVESGSRLEDSFSEKAESEERPEAALVSEKRKFGERM